MMLVYGQDIDDASPTVSIAFKENSGNYDLSRVAMFFKKGEYDDWSSLFITGFCPHHPPSARFYVGVAPIMGHVCPCCKTAGGIAILVGSPLGLEK